MSWFVNLFKPRRRSQHVCVTVIHMPHCTYRPSVRTSGWNALNYEWCKCFCYHLNVDNEILEARTHIVRSK